MLACMYVCSDVWVHARMCTCVCMHVPMFAMYSPKKLVKSPQVQQPMLKLDVRSNNGLLCSSYHRIWKSECDGMGVSLDGCIELVHVCPCTHCTTMSMFMSTCSHSHARVFSYSYLWKNFDPVKSTHAHIMSILTLINAKFRENLIGIWEPFHARKEVGACACEHG